MANPPRRPATSHKRAAQPAMHRRPASAAGAAAGGRLWLYGRHAVLAAFANPLRRIHRTLALADEAAALTAAAAGGRPAVEIVDRQTLGALLPAGAVHQGLAVLTEPLAEVELPSLLERLAHWPRALLVILDQATDPQNIGAVLRSAAAFGACAVVVQDRHAPDATAALAKAASGALESVPLVRVVNIARSIRLLQQNGFTALGLDGDAAVPIAAAPAADRLALVVGSEGTGLRRLVAESCDALVRIPIYPAMESLNLAAAAAVALYVYRVAGGIDDGAGHVQEVGR